MIGLAQALDRGPLGDRRPWATAQLLAVDPVTARAQVSIAGGASVWLPYISAVYTGISTVYVLMDPAGSGAGQLVLGPCGTQPAEDIPPPPPDPVEAPPKNAYALIKPNWSATWRDIWSNYSGWNASRYGGITALWQGENYGSGGMTGIATYGTQVQNLHALSITKISVHVPTADGSGTVVLQGSAHGYKTSSSPSPSGSTASGSLGGRVELGSTMREAMRTGSTMGLCTTGGTYLSVWGTARADGMALGVWYTRAA